MIPVGSKSSQTQSTLFQTWGYQGNIIAPPKASSSGAVQKEKRNILKKNASTEKISSYSQKPQLWTATSEQHRFHDNNEIMNELDNFDELMDGLDNDETDLSEAVKQAEKVNYVDPNFNPRGSPENLPGFDNTAGDNYIYPINYPMRDYQFNIIMKALIKNTLVVLPTGLGKTFIAAVVMYNFYRWYPQGKILFMAPTKPLVAQQIQACYSITGIPLEDTAEMTGSLPPPKRKLLWESKRVFFLTPHILQNDIGRGACFASNVVCLVFDEAHKALGNYAYCQVIKEVSGCQKNFRVLALSATPGDDMKAVQSVIENLMISHIELRSEDSVDIKPYVLERNVEKVVVPLSEELKRTKSQFHQVLQGVIGRLYANGACWQSDPSKISKFFLLKARDQFRERGTDDRNRVGMIEGDFALAISLYHAFELLQQHGILSFYNFLKEICSGSKGTTRARHELMRHEKFMEMMQDLQQQIEPPDDVNGSLNGSFLDVLTPKRRLLKSIPKTTSLFSSHPKLNKLEEIIVKHFENAKENVTGAASQIPLSTRVMIFSQYRDSVQEITAILNRHQPLVKVMSFVGQNGSSKGKKGLTQKEQLEVIERFRKGGYNVLVSTSVGEEGLDIGDVDLIVCFDASNSPIRLVQRMGRTGRKRSGKIVILVTEGKEEQIYKRSLTNKKSIHKKLLNAATSLVLYDESPRMIPKHLNPYCLKMQITVNAADVKSTRGTKRKSTDRKGEKTAQKKAPKKLNTIEKTMKSDGFLNPQEEKYWRDNFQIIDRGRLENAGMESLDSVYPVARLNEWLQWQNIPQPVKFVTHSTKTHMFCELIEHIETATAEMDGENCHYQELNKYIVDNCFIKTGCDRRKNKKKIKSSVLEKDAGCGGSDKKIDKMKGIGKNQSRKSDKQAMMNSAKSWRQRNLLSKEADDLEDDDDFMIERRSVKESKIPSEINGNLPSSSCIAKDALDLDDSETNVDNVGPDLEEYSDGNRIENHEIMGAITIVGEPESANLVNNNLLDFPQVQGPEDKDISDFEGKQNEKSICGTLACTSFAKTTVADCDNDEISSQKMSSLFPITTPNRSILKPNARSSEFKFRKRWLNGIVPSPPKLSDLSCLSFGNISELDELDEEVVNNDCVMGLDSRVENRKVEEMRPKEVDLCKNVSNIYKKKSLVSPPSKKSLEFCADKQKNKFENHETVTRNSLLNKFTDDSKLSVKSASNTKHDSMEGSEIDFDANSSCFGGIDENNQDHDIKPDDISNIDFGESFADICDFEDFEDCPSPPVVATIPVAKDTNMQTLHGCLANVPFPRDHKTQIVKLGTASKQCSYKDSCNNDINECEGSATELGPEENFIAEQRSDSKHVLPTVMSLPKDGPENIHPGRPDIPCDQRTECKCLVNCNKNDYHYTESTKNPDVLEKPELDLMDPDIAEFKDDFDEFPGDCGILNETLNTEGNSTTQRPVLSLVSRLRNRNVPGLDILKNGREEINLLDEGSKGHNERTLTNCNNTEGNTINTNLLHGDVNNARSINKHEARIVNDCIDVNVRESQMVGKQNTHFRSDGSTSEDSSEKSLLNRQNSVAKERVAFQAANFEEDSPLIRKKNRKLGNRFVNQNSDDEESPLNFRRKRKTKLRVLDESAVSACSKREALGCNGESDDESSNILTVSKRTTSTLRHKVKQQFKIDNQDSDDDFDFDTSIDKPGKCRSKKNAFEETGHKELDNKKKKKKSRCMSEFIDHEAEVTDAESGDEEVSLDENEYVMDSFIDDGTQMSQPTPARDRKGRNNVDMNMIYRQSLFSPLCGALNFRTPVFRADRNRYKMVGRDAWHEPSDEDDEAEEVNGLITDDDFEDDYDDSLANYPSPGTPTKYSESHGERSLHKNDEFLVPRSVCRPKRSRVRIIESDEESLENDNFITNIVKEEIAPEANHNIKNEKLKLSKKEAGEKSDFANNSLISEEKRPLNECSSSVTLKKSFKSDQMLIKNEELISNGKNKAVSLMNESQVDLKDMFIPDFDLGLDLGEVSKEMIESAWQEIAPSSTKASTVTISPVERAAIRPSVSTSTSAQENLIIFAQSKAISSCQVGSFLRLKYHISLKVCSQLACDFNVSKRMGIIRRSVSDISSGANGSKNMEAIREMCDQYPERCLIIEKDRVKGCAVNEKVVAYTKYYSGLLGYLVELKIKVLFSDSQEETALLISKLAKKENDKHRGFCENYSQVAGHDMEQMLKVLLTIPYLTYPIAVEICHKYKSFSAVIKSTPDELKAKIPQVSKRKAKELIQFFHHQVCLP